MRKRLGYNLISVKIGQLKCNATRLWRERWYMYVLFDTGPHLWPSSKWTLLMELL